MPSRLFAKHGCIHQAHGAPNHQLCSPNLGVGTHERSEPQSQTHCRSQVKKMSFMTEKTTSSAMTVSTSSKIGPGFRVNPAMPEEDNSSTGHCDSDWKSQSWFLTILDLAVHILPFQIYSQHLSPSGQVNHTTSCLAHFGRSLEDQGIPEEVRDLIGKPEKNYDSAWEYFHIQYNPVSALVRFVLFFLSSRNVMAIQISKCL